MKTHKIDDLLVRMSPQLLKFYETKNNLPGGKTLRQVNEEYKANNKKIMTFEYTIYCWMFVTVVLFLLNNFFSRGNYHFWFIPMIVWIVFSSAVIILIMKGRYDKAERELGILIPIMEKFRTTVDILDSPVNRISDDHCVGSLKEALILKAYWILDYEMKFDKVRMNKERQIRLIMQYGNVLEEYQKDLQSLLFVVEREFGFEFNKKEIFVEASKRFS
jgi:hypothetical protein